MNILFNSSGIPLLMQSTYIFGETTGTPQNEMKERTRILAPYDLSNVSYIDIDGVKCVHGEMRMISQKRG